MDELLLLERPSPFASHEPAIEKTTQDLGEEIDSENRANLTAWSGVARGPITKAGRVAYIGKSSDLSLLAQD